MTTDLTDLTDLADLTLSELFGIYMNIDPYNDLFSSLCSSVLPTNFFVSLKPIPLPPLSTCPWEKPLSSSQW